MHFRFAFGLKLYYSNCDRRNDLEVIMKKILSVISVILFSITTFLASSNLLNSLYAVDPVVLQPASQPVVQDLKKIGVNIGNWTTWGTAQMMSNILKNPGFEGSVDRVLVVVQRIDQNSFSDQRNQGQDDNYWINAHWEVRSGQAAGRTGTITRSLWSGEQGFPQYFVNGDLSGIQVNDVIVVRKEFPEPKVSQWWIVSEAETRVTIDTEEHRPGSPGVQSAVLKPESGKETELNFYFDANANDMGFNALPVSGPWKLTFWAKGSPKTAEGQMPTLTTYFKRLNGSSNFIWQTVPLTGQWQQFTYTFDAQDTGTPNTLKFAFAAEGDGTIWLDDVVLGSEADLAGGPFTQNVINILQGMQVGYLRDWQGQLGDSLANRLSDPFARRTFKSRSDGGGFEPNWGYSIPEFLSLAKSVNAIPWIILPTTLSDQELVSLGQFLAQESGKGTFQTIYIEFGNENWNTMFRPAALSDPVIHGQVANRAFDLLKQGAGSQIDMHLVVNAQHVLPQNSIQYLNGVPLADTLAIAPYYLHELATGTPAQQGINLLVAGDQGQWQETVDLVKAAGKKLAVYEINAHTTGGDATSAERDQLVAGQIAGPALAKQLIKGILSGTQPQLVFTLSQYKFGEWTGHPVRLWGVVRDLSQPYARYRPTGLAIAMLNNVLLQNAYPLVAPNGGNEQLTGVIFSSPTLWRGAIVSTADHPIPVKFVFPNDTRRMPRAVLTLGKGTPFDDNETNENVIIQGKTVLPVGRTLTFTLPAWSFAVFY